MSQADHNRPREVPSEIREIFAASDPYFPTPLQKFQFFDKYSRFNRELGRRETWIETVDRCVDFLKELSANKLPAQIYANIRNAILRMDVMPSMRLLAMAGEPMRRSNIAGYNCAFAGVDSIDTFVEALIVSMNGCGFGFSVEDRYIRQLPKIKRQRNDLVVPFHLVEDSADGWANALRVGLSRWFDGADIRFGYELIRPAGAVLKTKGGRASGPEPLKQLLDFCRSTILRRQGRKLRPIDAHDMMCAIGQGVVSGGVRRTAMISLFDQDDREMLAAKIGDFDQKHPERWNANNSAVWKSISRTSFDRMFDAMLESGRGEPGIFNADAALATLPSRRKPVAFGSNPCFGKDTLVQTKEGHFPIQDLIGRTVEIWNGEDWQKIDNFRITSRNETMLKITLHDGSEMRATRYHTFILEDGSRLPAHELVPGMKLQISQAPRTHGTIKTKGAYLKGFLLADGTHMADRPILYLYEPKYGCQERLIDSACEIPIETVRTNAIAETAFHPSGDNRMSMTGLTCRKGDLLPWTTDYKFGLPKEVFAWDKESKCQLLEGLFDGDGTASDTRNGFLYQLASISRTFLQDVQALLKTLGVSSHLSLMKAAGACNFNDGYGEYASQACWRLTLGQQSAIALSSLCFFGRLQSFDQKKTTYNLKPRFNRIEKIELDGVDGEVYCCTVEGSHSFSLTNGIHSAQCGEINLRSRQFCNLSAVVLRKHDTPETLREKVALATIIGTIQSSATYFPGLRPEWKQNCEEERLLGVDITGQMDNPDLLTATLLENLQENAILANRSTAALLGINPSAAITCVKPSGNTSQLVDCASGLHARWAPFYIRNVRVAASSPIARVLRAADVPMSPENGQDPHDPRTWVVSFPVKSPDGAITRNNRSAIEQCEWWLHNKLHWTEHNPSVTITYKPDEVVELREWVWKHREKIGGMAFLPSFDAKYDQLPYIEITEEEYEARKATFPEIDWSLIWAHELDDESSASATLACEGDVCLMEVPTGEP